MNPDQQPVSPATPQAPAYRPADTTRSPRRNTRKIVAIWLLVGPSALLAVSILAYAIINIILNSTVDTNSASADLFGGQQPVLTSVVNIILFLVGVVGTLTWLPGIIIGIVLLATQKQR